MVSEIEHVKVLFVDDEQKSALNYVTFLKKHCHEVHIAQDGIIALNKYKKFKPDLIFLDINLPNLSGIDVLKNIRQKDLTTKVIIFTAHSELHYYNKVSELGITEYLLKPISRLELKEVLYLVKQEIIEEKRRIDGDR